jgi:hypothetical protein
MLSARRSSLRMLVLVAGAIVMMVTVVAVGGGVASATVPVNAASYTVKCTSVSGTMRFSPSYKDLNEGVFDTNDFMTTVRAVLSGCRAKPTAGGTPVSVTGGTVAGSFWTLSDGSCDVIEHAGFPTYSTWYPLLYDNGTIQTSPMISQLTTKWKSSPTLDSGNTITTLGGVFGTASRSKATFTFPPNYSTGSFSGTDAGNSAAISVKTPLAGLLTACSSRAGLKRIDFTGTAHFG